MVLDLFPNNLFMALAEGNIPQIMILACFLGFLMRNLDNQTDKLNTTIDDLYTVFLNAIGYSVSFLPLFIFASLTGLLWENGYHAERTGHSPEWTLATPPVSGGTMICLNIMLNALGIPLSGLAIASVLALVFDFISTGSYIAMRHMEMVIQAGHLDLLDTEVLRSNL